MAPRNATTAVYIMTDKTWGTLCIGVTSVFLKRIAQHREGMIPGFTKKYGLKRLVWFELHSR